MPAASPTRIDLRGLGLPDYLLRAHHALARISSGEILTVLTDDTPHVFMEFQALAERTENLLVEQRRDPEGALHRLQRRLFPES